MQNWRNKKNIILCGVGVLVVALLWQILFASEAVESLAQRPVWSRVESSRFEVTVNAAGSLKAKDQAVIVNTLAGVTTILSVVDEGAEVEKGAPLIELDASSLQDQLVERQISVQSAQANFVQARENLEVVKSQSHSDVESARLAYQFAQSDLEKYRLGEFPNKKKEQLAQIAVAEEELRRAEEKLAWSKVLFEENFLSQTELQADELAAQKSRINRELSQSNLELLLKFTHVRQLTELEAQVKKTRMELGRNKRKAVATQVQAESELSSKKALLERETAKLDKVELAIAKTVIVAPQAGVVVYASSLQRNWRGNTEPLSAGQQVRERQELIYLPSTGKMVAETKIHESNLEKVTEGQAALVYVDSLPGRSFKAQVRSVALLPDAMSSWLNPDLKLYRTELLLLDHDEALRSGMNCRIEIQVDQFDKALAIPIQAVVLTQGKPFVYRLRDGDVTLQQVELGQSSESRVLILSGLQDGDQVQLNPPLEEAGGSGR